MKEIQLYLVKCVKSNPTRTLAYKIGICQDYTKRGIKNEFLGYANALTSNSKIDIEVEPNLILKGPDFFIKKLELSILNEYFKDDDRFFQTKEEYISSYEETSKKYHDLLKILEKEEKNIEEHSENIRVIDEIKQNNLFKFHQKLMADLCDKIITQLTPIKLIKQTTTSITAATTDKIKVKDILLQDYRLYQKGSKYYLQHQIYHKGKDPTEYRGAFSVDISGGGNKFQFHNNKEFLKKYNYDVTCISLDYVLRAFGSNVIIL